MNFPTSTAIDAGGNLFIADYFNSVIRRVSSSGVITTIAGNGKQFFDAESGAARQVAIDGKWVAIDRDRLLIGDSLFDRVRRLSPQTAKILTISSGDAQSGIAGKKRTVAVKVTDSDGLIVSKSPDRRRSATSSGTITCIGPNW